MFLGTWRSDNDDVDLSNGTCPQESSTSVVAPWLPDRVMLRSTATLLVTASDPRFWYPLAEYGQ